eukprot:1159279-Pelagomonas_calceolata.AAC.17
MHSHPLAALSDTLQQPWPQKKGRRRGQAHSALHTSYGNQDQSTPHTCKYHHNTPHTPATTITTRSTPTFMGKLPAQPSPSRGCWGPRHSLTSYRWTGFLPPGRILLGAGCSTAPGMEATSIMRPLPTYIWTHKAETKGGL